METTTQTGVIGAPCEDCGEFVAEKTYFDRRWQPRQCRPCYDEEQERRAFMEAGEKARAAMTFVRNNISILEQYKAGRLNTMQLGEALLKRKERRMRSEHPEVFGEE